MKRRKLKTTALILILLICCPFLLVGCQAEMATLNSYNIKADYNELDKTLSCEQSVTYFNRSDNILNEVCFFLYANAYGEGQKTISTAYYDKAYPNRASYGDIEFEQILICDRQVEFSVSENKNILTVFLSEDLFPDESVTIEMDYNIQLANINHRLGYGDSAVNFGNFFPIACVYQDGFVKNEFTPNGDPFYSEVSNFEVEISCMEDFVVATTGDKIEKIENGRKIISCSAQNVRDFCFVISTKFKVISQKVDGVDVNYYYYDDPNAEEHLQTAVNALQTFQNAFGKYPYKQLSVVETNFCFGGMEYPNLVMINDQITDNSTYNYVIVHEIAHQWWYGMVGNNQFTDAWIDEGLTEFSTALFFEKNSQYGFEYETVMINAAETYQNFVRVFEKINGSVDESMTRNLTEFSTEPEYVNCIYTKGMLLFDALRRSMSEKKFFNCLKSYFEQYKFKNSSGERLIESFSKTSHRSLDKFFEAWLNGTVLIGTE